MGDGENPKTPYERSGVKFGVTQVIHNFVDFGQAHQGASFCAIKMNFHRWNLPLEIFEVFFLINCSHFRRKKSARNRLIMSPIAWTTSRVCQIWSQIAFLVFVENDDSSVHLPYAKFNSKTFIPSIPCKSYDTYNSTRAVHKLISHAPCTPVVTWYRLFFDSNRPAVHSHLWWSIAKYGFRPRSASSLRDQKILTFKMPVWRQDNICVR